VINSRSHIRMCGYTHVCLELKDGYGPG
jgi:hypothetical protein